MSSRMVHNVGFYNLQPRAIHCLAYERRLKKLALSRSDNSIEIWNFSCAPCIERTIPARVICSVDALIWCNKRLFSAGFQGYITEYDLQKLSDKYDVPVTAGSCWCLASNKKNTHLAAGTEDGYINIFELTDEGLTFVKLLDRQQGRIICLSWDATGDIIVSGSVDAIRVWNVETGHAVHRMIPGHSQSKRETVVWCVTVTEDLTIISGDSRGRITFWDGNMGTQIESFPSHKADILCMCLSEDETYIYCAGIDPVIVSFSKVWIKSGNDTDVTSRSKWVKSVHRRIHDHDVRALTMADDKLLSAGVDSYLAISAYPPKMLVKYPPTPQFPCVAVCPEAQYIMLRHPTHLEVWRLGRALAGDNVYPEGALPLTEDPVHLLTLNSRGGDVIVCADMSSNGSWLAYSTLTSLNYFKFIGGGKPDLRKIPLSFDISSVHRIKFMPNNSEVVIATDKGDVGIVELSETNATVKDVWHGLKDNIIKDAIHLLVVSQDGKYIVVADVQSNIVVLTSADLEHHYSLPHYKQLPTAMGINPSTNELVIVYNNLRIFEYSLPQRKFTKFSRVLEDLPTQWLSKGYPVINVTFDPNKKDVILLQDDNTICVIDKNKQLPKKGAKIPRIGSPRPDGLDLNSSVSSVPESGFYIIKKYKHLVHLEWLKNDELVAVEVNPTTIIENLPPSLKRKRFGGM